MSRTLEPGISMLTPAEIRVVVLPIGPMPRDTFEGYLDSFNAHRHVPLNGTRPLYQGGPKTPFQHLPWKTGAMHFRFLQADDARRRTRIADLHQQRQVVAVLGLLHCPLVEDLMAAHSEFGRASRQWPEALVSRCCAFEPSPAHLASPGCQRLANLVVFPGGHLDQHLEVYMHEFAATVLAAVEDMVLSANASAVKLNTYVDSGEFLGPMAQIEEGLRKLNIAEEELKEKKRWGRLQKAKGDWALLAGSPRDAFEHYRSAMELSRVSGDAIWYGAAVEGLAHARVLEAVLAARPAATAGAAPNAAAPAASAAAAEAAAPGSPAAADAGAAAAAEGGAHGSPANGEASGASEHQARAPAPAAPRKDPLQSASRGAAEGASPCTYGLSGPAVWAALARAGLEGEVRELLGEARGWYRKKGGALALQIEQQLKLCRFLASLRGPAAASREAAETVALVLESLQALPLLEDRLIALTESGQLLGLVGCGRKRLLLLWAALELYRASCGGVPGGGGGGGGGPGGGAALESKPAGLVGGGPSAADAAAMLRLATRMLEPPEQPRQQDPDDQPRTHWSLKRFIAWQQRHLDDAEEAAGDGASAAAAASSKPAAPGGRNGRRASSGAAAQKQQQQPQRAIGQQEPPQQQMQQQQHFQQLLGPQLQLLGADQASLLRQLSGCQAAAGGDGGFAAARVWGLAGSGGGDWWRPWDAVQAAVLEAVVNLGKAANAPVEAWEAAATLLRESYQLLPQSLQASLMDSCGSAGAAMGGRLRARPGLGPGPQVQLRRVLPGPACLQPLRLSPADWASLGGGGGGLLRAEGAAGSAGPFIFNPYAAKRRGADAAAAAEAALPEWVCGDEGRVEVLLVNPCATPLKLEQLQLRVQPLPQPRADPGGAGAGAGVAACGEGGEQQQQQRGVSVSLPAGSKPVRVQLGFTPGRPGLLAVTGVQATCWGVSWFQPFVQLPNALAAAAATGREAVAPQGAYTVAVQPPLPLVKARPGRAMRARRPASGAPGASAAPPQRGCRRRRARAARRPRHPPLPTPPQATLHGPEVQLASPAEDELLGAGAAPGALAGPAAGSGPDGKAAAVPVFEGQSLCWTLNLTNTSGQPVTGCKVAVLNAKGQVLSQPSHQGPPGAAAAEPAAAGPMPAPPPRLPPSLGGAHMEVGEQALRESLPLAPGRSVSLPVAVTVGKPLGDAFDAVVFQLRITYHGSASPHSSCTAAGGGGGAAQLLGRQLSLAVRLLVQPTLQVKSMRFLQQTLPLRDGQRCARPRLLAGVQHHPGGQGRQQQDRPGSDARQQQQQQQQQQLAGDSPRALRRHASHARDSSDGATPAAGVGALMQLSRSPTRSPVRAGAHASWAGEQQPLPEGPSAAWPPDGEQQHAAGGASPTHRVGAAGGPSSASLAVGSDPVLELAVRNASERYFRAWLGCMPDRLSSDQALSAVAVLEPGDTQRLTAVLPHAPAAGAAAHPGAGALSEPSRLACAERLSGLLVVCWEMITGASGAAGQAPRGKVHLAPVDVAAHLSQAAVASLCPSPLTLRLSAPPATSAPGTACPGELADLLALLVAAAGPGAQPGPLVRTSGSQSFSAAHLRASGSLQGAAAQPAASLPGLSGPLWGLCMSVGEWLMLDLEVAYYPQGAPGPPAAGAWLSAGSGGGLPAAAAAAAAGGGPVGAGGEPPLLLQLSLCVCDLLGGAAGAAACGSGAGSHQPGTPKAAIAGLSSLHLLQQRSSVGCGADGAPAAAERLVDPGVFLSGGHSAVQVAVAPGQRRVLRMHALLLQPGLYQFGVADVSLAPAGAAGKGGGAGCPPGGRVYFSQDRLYVLAAGC